MVAKDKNGTLTYDATKKRVIYRSKNIITGKIVQCVHVKVKKLDPNAKLPEYAHPGDAGADLFAFGSYSLPSLCRIVVRTGIALAISEEHVGLIWDKSGLAAKNGITVLAGVVDSGYRGEIKVCLFNTTEEDFLVESGSKVAQLLVQKVDYASFSEVAELDSTDRGIDGVGFHQEEGKP
jgi:dUTP pyrophosphatase